MNLLWELSSWPNDKEGERRITLHLFSFFSHRGQMLPRTFYRSYRNNKRLGCPCPVLCILLYCLAYSLRAFRCRRATPLGTFTCFYLPGNDFMNETTHAGQREGDGRERKESAYIHADVQIRHQQQQQQRGDVVIDSGGRQVVRARALEIR